MGRQHRPKNVVPKQCHKCKGDGETSVYKYTIVMSGFESKTFCCECNDETAQYYLVPINDGENKTSYPYCNKCLSKSHSVKRCAGKLRNLNDPNRRTAFDFAAIGIGCNLFAKITLSSYFKKLSKINMDTHQNKQKMNNSQ